MQAGMTYRQAEEEIFRYPSKETKVTIESSLTSKGCQFSF
jgi:hypothetical protein